MVYIDDIVHRFVIGIEDCYSIDCILVRLSTAVSSIRERVYTLYKNVDEKEVVQEFLSHPEVAKILAGLVNHIAYVEERIQSDVRFKNLRPYLPSILNAIRQNPQQEVLQRTKEPVVKSATQVKPPSHHLIPYPVERCISTFVAGAKDCRSIDCVLTKLSTAFLYINDFAKRSLEPVRENELVKTFLSHLDVMKVLAGLAENLEYVETKISNDMRFENLRPYQNEILDAIKMAYQIYVPTQRYETYERPPTWKVEHAERTLADQPPPPSSEDSSEEYRPSRAKRIPVIKRYREQEELDTSHRMTTSSSDEGNKSYEASAKTSTKRRVSLPRVGSPKLFLALCVLLLLALSYVFVKVPWIIFYGEQIGSIKTTSIQTTASGWDMTWLFIEYWRTFNMRPPMFIAYFIGLLLAVIALVAKSTVLSTISGLAMLIGWYDFYEHATTYYKIYVQLVALLGLINIKNAELAIGTYLAGILSFLYLVFGTYLIHKMR